jgi:hypothetical protein
LWFNPALRTQLSESPVRFAIFGAGLILVAVGAVVVLVAAPKAAPKKTAAVSVETREAVSTAVGETDSEKSKSPGAEQSPAPDIMPQGEAN